MDNNLKGTIPSSFGSLTKLTGMVLSSPPLGATYNNLEGTIPSSLGLLTKLARIDLSGNNLKGTIPASFRLLTELSFIQLFSPSLRGNSLTGLVPPLPFKQIKAGGGDCNIGYDFKCPLPAGSEQCTWSSGSMGRNPGVKCS
jgi:hypothetical protein